MADYLSMPPSPLVMIMRIGNSEHADKGGKYHGYYGIFTHQELS